MIRLGILVSHPIQYYTPWFRHLSKRLDIEVFYAHRQDKKGQAEAGFDVEFDWDIPLLEGYPYRWLKNVARYPSVNSFSGCDTPEIDEIIECEKFNAFLILGWNKKSYIQAIRACWKNKVPILMRGDSQLNTKRSWFKSAVKYFPYRWFLSRIDAHLYVGKRNRKYFKHYGIAEDKLFFCPHFVDNDFFVKKAKEAVKSGKDMKIRKQFDIPFDAFVLLYVGKFIPVKRPADFIKACLDILESPEGSNIYAILVGDGPLRKDLENMAQLYSVFIHFSDFRNQTELPAFYTAADALVLPGRETWGLVVNEAMACGLPSIVSDTAGCAPDLIDDGETGNTYPVGNIDALDECILILKKECVRKKRMIQKALSEKIACYSIEKATEGLECALHAVVGRQ